MILRQALVEATRALREAGVSGPERDARILLAEILQIPASRVSLEPDLEITEVQRQNLLGMLHRRSAKEPVSRILGRRQFWGRDFKVTPEVLDPRPETESLIAAALDGPVAERLLDLGCGSGIIAITLLAEWGHAQGVATDISPACLDVAAQNAKTHGVSNRLQFVQSDWFQKVQGTFDLILSNPPYITDEEMADLAPEVALHDPHLALTPGGNGLASYIAIAEKAAHHLSASGRVFVEIGWQQGPDVSAIFTNAGLQDVQILPDLDGRDRVVFARSA